jgi:lipopolysaccharide/colanic/teichoic acid biosynthesis glycosyltransferase
MIKRIIEVLIVTLSLVILSPLLLVLSILILISDGYPILYKQERVGLHGNGFLIYKFRTMVKNATDIGPYFTSRDDPRITRIGGILRKTSMDELPQLFNVLMGDMSMVGPRPNVEKQRMDYEESDWELRNSVRPGITGLAQVSGRSCCTFEERLGFDLIYVRSNNISLDINIIFRTIIGVLLKKGSF